MERVSRGNKRSSWSTFKRRLLIVRLLLRSPQTKAQLIENIQQSLGDNGYQKDPNSALKNDFDALKIEFGCEIKFNRKHAQYALHNLGELALLDLSDECFDALLFLDSNFPQGEAVPDFVNVPTLLQQIIQLLPPERRETLTKKRAPRIARIAPTTDQVSPKLLAKLEKVLKQQEISFEYKSNQPDTPLIWYRVAPYNIEVKPDGHIYLDAATLEINPKQATLILPTNQMYRIDRIQEHTLQILPTVLPPYRSGLKIVTLRYWLHPNVARRKDISHHFPETQVTYQEDGSAIVTAKTNNLWQARQTLFRYGSACIVQEPPELVELFKKAIREMSDNYFSE
jgi:predicted DNA-binding transcriptional regulator YafY